MVGAVWAGADIATADEKQAGRVHPVHIQKLSDSPIDLICELDEKSIAVAVDGNIVVWRFQESLAVLEPIAAATLDVPSDLLYLSEKKTLLIASQQLSAWDIANRSIELIGVTPDIDANPVSNISSVYSFSSDSTGRRIAVEQYENVPLILSRDALSGVSPLPIANALGPIAWNRNGRELFVVEMTDTETEIIAIHPLSPAAGLRQISFRETINGVTRSIDTNREQQSAANGLPARSGVRTDIGIRSAFGRSDTTYVAVATQPKHADEWPRTAKGDLVHEIWDLTSATEGRLIQIFSHGEVADPQHRGSYCGWITVDADKKTEQVHFIFVYSKGLLDVRPKINEPRVSASGIGASVFREFPRTIFQGELVGEVNSAAQPLSFPRIITGHRSGHVVVWEFE